VRLKAILTSSSFILSKTKANLVPLIDSDYAMNLLEMERVCVLFVYTVLFYIAYVGKNHHKPPKWSVHELSLASRPPSSRHKQLRQLQREGS
jgi:hypothetical protein